METQSGTHIGHIFAQIGFYQKDIFSSPFPPSVNVTAGVLDILRHG